MEKKDQVTYSQLSPNSESSVLVHSPLELPQSHVIPKWKGNIQKDTGTGQQLFIPDTDELSLIAKAPLSKMLCCHTTFACGDFKVEKFEGCRVVQVLTQKQVEDFCTQASEHCSIVMKQAVAGKHLFYLGVSFMSIICMLISIVGILEDLAWLCVISIFLFVLGVGCCYEIINSRARRIYDVLQGFIELNDAFTGKGIQVKAGPYGTYIEFSLNSEKSIS